MGEKILSTKVTEASEVNRKATKNKAVTGPKFTLTENSEDLDTANYLQNQMQIKADNKKKSKRVIEKGQETNDMKKKNVRINHNSNPSGLGQSQPLKGKIISKRSIKKPDRRDLNDDFNEDDHCKAFHHVDTIKEFLSERNNVNPALQHKKNAFAKYYNSSGSYSSELKINSTYANIICTKNALCHLIKNNTDGAEEEFSPLKLFNIQSDPVNRTVSFENILRKKSSRNQSSRKNSNSKNLDHKEITEDEI